MFQGEARAALRLYETVFPQFETRTLEMIKDEVGAETGEVASALIAIAGQEIMVVDSPPVHDFTFTPSASIFIECDDEAELRQLAEGLAEGGQALMPTDNYGFSQLFAWIADRYGVSWQLNLA